jgi:phosphoribosylformylglycinamidine synthase PurS subunit
MNYTATIHVMPHKDLLDPQGKAVLGGLSQLGLQGVHDVRIGKQIVLEVEADSPETARAIAQTAADQLLANPVMEMAEISIA